MKTLLIAATAVMMMTAGGAFADQVATMPVDIVSQDTIITSDGGIIVPILTMIFLLAIAAGGHGYPYPS